MDKLGFADDTLERGPWKGQYQWVSQFNYADSSALEENRSRQIVVHDSTLRDGEQAPGVSFSVEQKIEIAKRLDAAGIQYIEAGFPAVSDADATSVAKIASLGLDARITCLSRATEKDVDLAADCGVWAAIMEVPVGYPRLKYQFEWTEDEVLSRTFKAIEHARKRGVNVILFFIDTARVRAAFLKRFIKLANQDDVIKRISLVDTLGAATPEAMRLLVSTAKEWTDKPLEVHCHDDFGLGTVNTITGLMSGAEAFSGTINGLGQRAGNAAVEEVIMAMHLLYGVPTELRLDRLRDLSTYVQELSGVRMPQYKAVVGEKLFHWEAGIPTAALRKLPTTVEPYVPDLVGADHSIVLGKKTGKANILFKLEEMNLPTDDDVLVESLVQAVKSLAINENRTVSDDEFKKLYDEHTQ